MRTFSKSQVEYFEFQIEGDEKIYKVPLAGSMTNRELIAFKNTNGDYEAQLEWLRAYIGDAVDEWTPAQTGEIIRAWSEATNEQGASVGES